MTVLIIRFSSLGDVVLATAVIEALNRAAPDAELVFLTRDPFQELFHGDPRLAETVAVTGSESPSDIVRLLGTDSFDAIVDLHASLRSRAVTFFLRSPRKLRVNKHALARRIMVWSRNRYRRSFDVVGSELALLESFGVRERILPRLVPCPGYIEEARALLDGRGDGGFVGFAPGARHEAKRWNEKSFAELADAVVDRGLTPVFLGDSGDNEVIGRISGMMKSGHSLDLSGKSLGVTAAVVSRFRCIVTNDSAPMHIAGALGVPFTAVFGPTHADLGFVPGYPNGITLHTGVPCSPCSIHGEKSCRMPERYCMDGITWRKVLSTIESSL